MNQIRVNIGKRTEHTECTYVEYLSATSDLETCLWGLQQQ